ncbi:MAG: hypothetical protein JOZ67_07935 [Gammaproteobacteria bacterium]|nr:hypothetical protein [Gammaproteobacteria bacterium]MBV9697721.1 hypothetical protein [Gammaproteobacteria bacterium]
MKLRIKGATLRLRLTQGELARFGAGEPIEEQVPFPGGALRYRLRRAPVHAIEADFARESIEVRVPEAEAARWCATELVTLSAEQAVPGGTLRITLEKDFACLAPRSGEDESDHFPHPGGPGRC